MSKMEKEIIKSIKAAGVSEKQIKRELEVAKASFGGFVKNPDTLAILIAKKHGVPINTPKRLGKFRSIPEKMDISDISTGMTEKNIITSGFIIKKKKGKTRAGNPKVNLTITNGSSIINTSVFDEAYNSYKAIKFELFDKIKFTGAKIFEFKSDRNDDMITMITAGKFTTVEKLNKDIKKALTDYSDADVGTLAVLSGIVTETSENAYPGCPDCSKKGDAKDTETEFECECGYSGLPKEYIITNAVISNGEENNVITIFPRLGVTANDISDKLITAVGKKNDDKLSVIAIRPYDIDLSHVRKQESTDDEDEEENNSDDTEETSEGEVEETSEGEVEETNEEDEETDKEDEELEETSEGEVENFSSNAKKLRNKIKDVLEMFPSGIAKSGLIEIIKAKEKVKRSKIIRVIKSLIKKGEIEEDDDKNIKLTD